MYVCLGGLTPFDAEFACVIILLIELIACDTTLYILSLNGNASYLSDNIIYMRGPQSDGILATAYDESISMHRKG